MTDVELKEKMEERQMCEEAPGVINTPTAIMMITKINFAIINDHQD